MTFASSYNLQGTYPDILVFKDSRVTWIVLSVFWGAFSALVLFTFITGGKADLNAVLMSAGIFVAMLLFTLMPSTVSELSPDGVKIKAAFSKPIYRQWSEVSDLGIYRQAGYLFTSRRFVTFQDPSKTLQKHVFLVPIRFGLNPDDVLQTVKNYQADALADQE